MWVRYGCNGKVLEEVNPRSKPGDPVAVDNLSCYISEREEVSSIFSISVRRAWKNYPCSPKDRLSVVVGKLFMQIWLCFHSSWFRLWRHRRWRFFVSFDERTDSGGCPGAATCRKQHTKNKQPVSGVQSIWRSAASRCVLIRDNEGALPKAFCFGDLWRKLLNMDGFPTKLLSLFFSRPP